MSQFSLFPEDLVSQCAQFSKVAVPLPLVSEGRLREQAWCMMQADDGWWEVFYYERGSRTSSLGRAESRLAALRMLGGRLLYSDVVNREPGN